MGKVTAMAMACVLLAGCASLAGTSAGAGGSGGGSSDDGGPTPTTGFCGMDPEPVPCVDRAGDGPVPTQVGAPRELGGSCMSGNSADRCQALAFEAARQLGTGFDQVVSVDVVPDPSPEAGPDFAHRTFLVVTTADSARHDIVVSCPGVSGAYDPPCMSQPVVPLIYPIGSEGSGYGDIPGGATPLPSLDPAAVAQATPLRISSLIVPVTGTGPGSMVLGRATLPNGYLSTASFGMADPWPANVLFDTGITLTVTSTSNGGPFENEYEHGWRPGTEGVEVTLSYDVAWFEPGATFTIVDVLVR
jgi:hypothetical protein